jgi:cholest-4-en-3-one 26-monooxygenase
VPLDLSDPDLYTRGFPHDVFRDLRRDDPVSWQIPSTGPGFWAVTRYADVVAVLKTPKTFSSWIGGPLLNDPPPQFLDKLREGMLSRDPPDHTMLRRLVNKAFSPRRIEQLDAKIAEHARVLVDRVRGSDRCDFATEIAGEMPLFAICEILGVPHADRAMLYSLTARMFGSEIADPEAAFRDGMVAAEQIRAYGADLGRAKAAEPGEDIISDLLAAELDGQRLTGGEFQAFFMLLFNAGADTTRSLLCFAVDLLLERPELYAELRGNDELLASTIEEVLRFESPVIQFRRTAAHDTELGAARIRAGDKVLVFFPSANRDEAVFADPDHFDPRRTPNEHVAFGYGTHFCLGAPLARLESRHVLRAMVDAFTAVERGAPLVPSRTNFIRSVRHLELHLRG